jgi:hypothetical protein
MKSVDTGTIRNDDNEAEDLYPLDLPPSSSKRLLDGHAVFETLLAPLRLMCSQQMQFGLFSHSITKPHFLSYGY